MKKKAIPVFIIFLFGGHFFVEGKTTFAAQQHIKDFYLSNFREDGLHDWEIQGDDAFVSDNYVDIETMKAKYYREDDVIDIFADNARLDRTLMEVDLHHNVRVVSQQGVRLFSDHLRWEQKNNLVFTDSPVEVLKEDTVNIKAQGMKGNTELYQLDFKRDVVVDVRGESEEVTTVTCDGPLEIDYNKGIAIFRKNVFVKNSEGTLQSDEATLYIDTENNQIEKIIATGKVEIKRGDNVTYAQRATYYANEKRVVLEGHPRVVIYPDSDKTMVGKNENSRD